MMPGRVRVTHDGRRPHEHDAGPRAHDAGRAHVMPCKAHWHIMMVIMMMPDRERLIQGHANMPVMLDLTLDAARPGRTQMMPGCQCHACMGRAHVMQGSTRDAAGPGAVRR